MINGITLLADDAPKLTEPVASGWHLVLACLVGIGVIVVRGGGSKARANRERWKAAGASGHDGAVER